MPLKYRKYLLLFQISTAGNVWIHCIKADFYQTNRTFSRASSSSGIANSRKQNTKLQQNQWFKHPFLLCRRNPLLTCHPEGATRANPERVWEAAFCPLQPTDTCLSSCVRRGHLTLSACLGSAHAKNSPLWVLVEADPCIHRAQVWGTHDHGYTHSGFGDLAGNAQESLSNSRDGGAQGAPAQGNAAVAQAVAPGVQWYQQQNLLGLLGWLGLIWLWWAQLPLFLPTVQSAQWFRRNPLFPQERVCLVCSRTPQNIVKIILVEKKLLKLLGTHHGHRKT